jgi:hypothetical protein
MKHQVLFRCTVLASSIFIRRKVIHERRLFFDTKWRDLGDIIWVMSLMEHQVPMMASHKFLSIFADAGEKHETQAQRHSRTRREEADVTALVKRLEPFWIFAIACAGFCGFRFPPFLLPRPAQEGRGSHGPSFLV